ncbi:radical SAM/SPASM domain-containing protein [Thermococcus celer]|uniref:Radical SAM core domain-containing protein n=1 Tax=Thermococcus celer Vu 13 = JCM 8558 TaxID=1293037 RepID=A0A218NZE8_THECE|nr:radical SAM protein [Thermococcus celer]ASI98074.1 hypothetical protein A3L02_00045 [Thermococcus celer Vu 13 = JCM 8558]
MKYVVRKTLPNGQTILFNILTRSIEVVSDNADNESISQKLKASFILVDGEEALSRYVHNKLKYPSEDRLIIIDAWTLNCNLSCTYCMQQDTRKLNPQLSLSPEERVQIWDQLRRIFRKEYIDVLLFGGEPFYDPSYVEEMLSMSKNLSIPVGHYSAITNGVFKDPERTLEIITEYPFEYVQITLDGPPRIHDKRRIFPTGNGTFNKIMENIRLLLEHTDIRIIIHSVIDAQNWKYYGEMLDILLNKFGDHIKDRRIVFNVGMESHPSSPCTHTISNIPDPEQYATMFLYAIREAINRKVPIISFLSESVCTYNKDNELLVGPDGSIYKCTSAIGLDNFKVASKEEVFHNPELFLVKYAQFIEGGKGDNYCWSCQYFPVCGGGCVYNAWIEGKKKDCWAIFHQKTLPKFAEMLLEVDEIEPDIWVPLEK